MLLHHSVEKSHADVNYIYGKDERLYVQCVSRACSENEKESPKLNRKRYFLHFVDSGEVLHDGILAVPGDVYLLEPGVVHRLEVVSEEPLVQYCVEFFGTDAAELCCEAGLTPTSRHRVSDPSKLRRIFHEAVYDTEGMSDSALVKLGLGLLYFFLSQLVSPENEKPSPELRSYVKRASEFMRANYMYGIKASDAAKAVGLTEKYLCRLFRRELGITPTDYLADCRERRALELLRSDDLTVSEVSHMVGIDDPTYFSRFIRSRTGKSPSKLRGEG